MGLIGNYNLISKSPSRFLAGTTVSADRSNFSKPGSLKNRFVCSAGPDCALLRFTQIPNGYNGSSCWAMGITDGGIGSNTVLYSILSTNSANFAGGKNAEVLITGAITVSNADLALVVSLVGALTGAGLLAASSAGILQAAAAVTGHILVSNAGLGAIVDTLASIYGSGLISNAELSNSARLITMAVNASISTSGAVLTALGSIESDILPYTELSPESLAAAVWNKSVLDELDAGTYGKLMKQLKALISAGL